MDKIKGITLIALVITIIVLLILAGVSIAMLTGQNGILNQANQAKEQTEIGREKEYIKLAFSASKSSKLSKADTSAVTSEELKTEIIKSTSNVEVTNSDGDNLQVHYTDSNRTYIVDQNGEITLDEAPAIPPKHPDQSSSNDDIGIDEDGNAVNMDYWKSSIHDGTICLNDYLGSSQGQGYIGPIVDGKIVGKVPKYVKKADQNRALKVTRIDCTFSGYADLTTAPEIPNSVTDIFYTFSGCRGLTTIPKIPNSVTNIDCAFMYCTSLTTAPEIPSSVISMKEAFLECTALTTVKIPNSVININNAFYGCTNLTTAPEIPNSVKYMNYTFYDCTNLTTVTVIPDSVADMYRTFKNCSSLTGNIVINAIPYSSSSYMNCFDNASTNEGTNLIVTGTSPDLDEIIATKSANSHITKGN